MDKRNSLVTFSVLAGLIALIILLHALGWLRFLENGFVSSLGSVARPISHLTDFINPKETDGLSREELIGKLEAAEADNRKLLAENAVLKDTAAENETLRRYLSYENTSGRRLIMASVIARGNAGDNWRNRESVILNRGTADGLLAGLPIVSSDGLLLGKILQTEDHSAEACLLYSSDCKIAVSVAGEQATLGVAQGDLGLTVKVDFIGQDKDLGAGGQVIVTAGLEEGMPQGLVIGTVSQVIKQPNELWQNALLQPSAQFGELRSVSILIE